MGKRAQFFTDLTELLQELRSRNSRGHFTRQSDFHGDSLEGCLVSRVRHYGVNELVDQNVQYPDRVGQNGRYEDLRDLVGRCLGIPTLPDSLSRRPATRESDRNLHTWDGLRV